MKKRFTVKSMIAASALSVFITLGAVALVLSLVIKTPELAVISAMGWIDSQFIGEVDKDALADAAVEGMVNSLDDRWSYFADAETYSELMERRNNSFVGIGVTVTYEEDGVHIQSLVKDSPAEQAGLLPGEIITAVDGFDLTGGHAEEGSDRIGGEEGTEVVLDVLEVQGNTRSVSVIRARITEISVTYEMLSGDVGYVAILNFFKGTADQTKTAVEDLLEQGARSIVFDVRNNPGGYLDELLDLLDYLLPEGPIFQSGSKDGERLTKMSDAACVDVSMVVLVNENSYSAAELFAAQLRESLNVPIVGQPTSGKGRSQQVFELPGGRAINISTKTYYTGAGVSLVGVGVVPDKIVSLTAGEDPQLKTALELLA